MQFFFFFFKEENIRYRNCVVMGILDESVGSELVHVMGYYAVAHGTYCLVCLLQCHGKQVACIKMYVMRFLFMRSIIW